ncbi:exosome nuclease subunit [Spiromyces aspiralis]|uniref:Exosome nuclease subunit n=1 Tax=Spiromyces aspiralis TaxID=68401 RepID=A0ACC1HKH0_9FUNG|nr:exosome nuclease subunit [Spiromyces aspiralis]
MAEQVPSLVDALDCYLKKAYAAMVAATKAVNRLPGDLDFYRTMDSEFSEQLDQLSVRVLGQANRLWSRSTPDMVEPITELDDVVDTVALAEAETAGTAAPTSSKDDGQQDNTGAGFRRVIDAVDGLLERVDIGIEEIRGTRKPSEQTSGIMQSKPMVTTVASSSKKADGKLDLKLIHAQHIPRPQLTFKDKIDNSESTPFIWKIKKKLNAKVPLDYGIPGVELSGTHLGSHLESMGLSRRGSPTSSGAATPVPHGSHPPEFGVNVEQDDSGLSSLKSLPHPYQYEITHIEYPASLFTVKEPVPPQDWDKTPFEFVDTVEKLTPMLKHINRAEELAVDLEHHNYRSFQGFTCLIQISTRTRDYVVDAIALRSEMHQLNQPFTDPSITKVLHGADSDVIWLQRDFGVYIVNLFDTYHATKVLNFQHHSLASLLKQYCNFEADKRYQLADWRIRPLPAEMMDYARSDTHFLLYIFDHLRKGLLERGQEVSRQSTTPATQLMDNVLRLSAQTSLRRYEKEGYDAESGTGPNGWATLLEKWHHPFRADQMAIYRALHQWRDRVAREEDESLRYVLPNHMLFILADRMPTEVPQLLAACQPTPPLVRMYAADLTVLIKTVQAESQLRMSEMKQLAQEVVDEEESKLRKETTHIRFESEGEGDDAHELVTAQRDVLDDADLVSSVRSLMVPSSALFSPDSLDSGDKDARGPGAAKAEAIRQSLALIVATPKQILTSSDTQAAAGGRGDGALEVLEMPGEHEFVPASKRQKSKHGPGIETVVISKKYGTYDPNRPTLADDSTNSMEIEEEGEEGPSLASPAEAEQIARVGAVQGSDDVQGDRPELVPSPAQRPKKNKKNKAKSGTDNSATNSSTTTVNPEDIQPYDYSKSQGETLIPERPQGWGTKPKRQKKAAGATGTAEVFDPYAQPEVLAQLARKARKNNAASGSGGKSFGLK